MRVANSFHNEVGMGSKREVAGFYEVMDWLLVLLVKASSIKCEHSLLFVASFGSNTHVVAGGDLGDFPMRVEEVDFFLELFSREQLSETPRNYVPQSFKTDYVKGISAAANNVGLPIFLADGSRLGTLCLFDASTLGAESEWVSILTRLASTIEDVFSSAYLMTVESGALQLYGSHKIQSLVQALTQRLLNVVDAQSLDLHERRQRKLQKNPTAFEMLQVSTWQAWPSLGKFEVSDSWVRLTGLSSDAVSEYTAPRLFQDFHPDDYDACLLQFNQFLSGESTSYKTEARVRGAENTWVWLSSQGWVTELDCEGKPTEVLFTHVDISDQKKQAQHLENSQAFLDRTSRLAGVGGWEVDFQNNTVTWCNETRRIYGVGPDFEPVADHYIKYCAPDARHIIQAAVDIAMQGGPGFDLELPFVRLDKQGIWARVVGTIEFSGSTAIRMVGSLQDVSDRVLERLELAQANERATLATNSGGIGIWDWDVINDMLRWDSWMYHLYGALPNDLANSISWWTRQIHPDDISSVERALRTALQGGPSIDVEFRAVWPDGSLKYIHCTGLVKYSDLGEPIRMVGTNRDVTNARHLATELSEQHEMLRVTLKSIGDAVITTDAKGNVAWLNPVAENLTGWLSSEASGLPLSHVFHIIHQNTGLPAEDPVAICLRKEIASSPNNQTLLVSRTGQEYGIEDSAAPIRNEHGEILGAVLVFHDVTEQRRLSSELNYRASHDHLTGLVNRAEFETRLGRALRRTHESGACHTLLYIDLDQFKLVNDACGHAVGDQVLQQVSKLLSTCVRERDTLARLGGDEFGVILEHCCAEHALRVAQNICDAMEKFRFLNEGRRFRIGASIGLVPVDSRWNTTLALQQAADTSCYAAKEAGRNRVHAWFDSDTAMHARHGEMQWTMRIEQALDEGRFVLYAQRITPLNHSSNAVHAEVLLRMLDADGALIPPGAFLPAAERFHLASRIDRWVLTRAIEWMEALPANARVETLSINLSGQSVGDRAFHAWTLEVLLTAGSLVCSRLCFEVTETSAVTNFSDAALFIEQIRAVGVRVALDDFGAGASSFGYLKTLPVDYLKIDGQFVKNVVTDPLDDAAVRCFIDVARVLGVKTVAEYVENITVQNHLRELGVDFVQGYLLHRPSPISDLVGNQNHL